MGSCSDFRNAASSSQDGQALYEHKSRRHEFGSHSSVPTMLAACTALTQQAHISPSREPQRWRRKCIPTRMEHIRPFTAR